MLTGSIGLAGGEKLSRGGEEAEGEAMMASKNAALLLTELRLGLRITDCGTIAGLLVLQLWPDCWRSAVSDVEAVATPSVLVSTVLSGVALVACKPADSSI